MSNFSIEELCFSETAVRLGINNTPSVLALDNLNILIAGLEQVRTVLNNKPLNINSGYRGPTLNRAVGGASSSAHCFGFAADFTCRSFGTPEQIVKAILSSDIKYDQLIYEGTWVHISFHPQMRQQALNANFSNGKVSYSVLSS